MFASSSKRAISSTTTVTSLPRRAASISASISTELTPVRYTVCLIGDDVRIVGGAADELDDRLERLVRMVQQDVVLADRREDVRLLAQPVREARERTARYLSASMSTWSTSDDEARDVDRPVAAVEIGVA